MALLPRINSSQRKPLYCRKHRVSFRRRDARCCVFSHQSVGGMCFTGLDHGGPGLLANAFPEGTYSAMDPDVFQEAKA